MATIDKPLPNVSETVIEVPKQEELVEAKEDLSKTVRTLKITNEAVEKEKAKTENALSHLKQILAILIMFLLSSAKGNNISLYCWSI